MDEKRLIFLAIFSTVLACGLLLPFWAIFLTVFYLVKMFRPKPEPKVVLPDNSFVDDWVFVIKPPTVVIQDHL